MDQTFTALANAHRRTMLDILKAKPGLCVNDIAAHFDMSRVAVMKHLAVLEAAQLVVTERVGKEKHHYFNVIPIQQIYDRWTDQYSRFMASRLTAFKDQVEQQESDDEQSQQQKCS
ncbi:metalloregulator ArsR/SmtB family transcription factor [Aestuariibacter halophilus]|uniref:Metalloregulator ArsR/SmtB family transcription factor n=1 Tax=Fluctibacter halophilus TaxID=226011 RepID=A0ABS8GBF6_9ALTE|nr:metalloregulator ArsR/SmtB family transcription factor [Aestuariibacter halophilus]MCC2617828.1 metalloregulator ArsR/SmtB family transcription factor [Aestuariibacter halophilus]